MRQSQKIPLLNDPLRSSTRNFAVHGGKRRSGKEVQLEELGNGQKNGPLPSVHMPGAMLPAWSSSASAVFSRYWSRVSGVSWVVSVLPRGEETELESPLAMLQIDMSNLTQIGWLILAVLSVQAVLSFGRVLLFAKMTEDMMLAMRRDAFEAIVSMPMRFFDTRRVGDLNSRVSADITSIQDVFTTTLAELLRQIIIIVGGILALLYFSVTLTLLMLITLPVMIIAAILFGRFIRKLSKRTQDQVAESNTIVQETLTGIISVKSFANEAWEVLRYLGSIRDIRALAMKGAIWRGAFASFIILFIFGAITLVIFKGGRIDGHGGIGQRAFFYVSPYDRIGCRIHRWHSGSVFSAAARAWGH